MPADRAMIQQTASTLFQDGAVAELRIPNTPRHGTVSGYFNTMPPFVDAVETWSGQAPAVYATLNPCNPALLARAANRLKERVKTTTSDSDIVRRYWFPLDFDPIRPADISSTDAEHDAALERAEACTTWLQSRGWPQSVAADSGNGGHRLYRIDLPNDDDSRTLLQRCLEALAMYFSDQVVTLDLKVFNAARIWKVYGTMVCKGDNLPERPHRLSRLLDVPAPVACVTRQQLEELAALLPAPATPTPRRGMTYSTSFDLQQWITSNGLPVVAEGAWQQSGYRWVLNPCPWNSAHTNRSAFIVQFPHGAIAAGCHHNGCSGNNWYALRDLYEPGWPPAGGLPQEAGITSQLLRKSCEVINPHEISSNAITSLSSLTSHLQHEKKWPVLLPEALYGLAGAVVRAIEPHSESDPVALLVQFLTMFGVVLGRHCYGQVEATKHCGNLFAVIAGRTARSRKGTSYGHIERLFEAADPTWSRERLIKGAGSGEGLVYAVRDKRMGREPIKVKGRIIDYQEVEIDPGVADKRALYMTGEFSSVLKVAAREGNILSETLRDIWDTGYLRCTTRHNPLTATDAHIGIIGHITIAEIRKLMTSMEMGNGFANRFVWLCAKRSQELPEGGAIASVDFSGILVHLRQALEFSKQSKKLVRNTEARKAWAVVYGMLAENRTGLADTLLARAEAIVFRLSILYALLDCSAEIRLEHLNAALALWQYAEDSATYIFGETVGDEIADPILQALTRAGEAGLTREQLTVEVFQKHISAAELSRALTLLEEQGRITCAQKGTNNKGRPATVYHLWARQNCEESEENTRRYLIASNDAAKQEDIDCEEIAKKLRRNSQNQGFDSQNSGFAAVNGVLADQAAPGDEPGSCALNSDEPPRSSFTAFTASELWCPSCQTAQPVQLVGRAYHCQVCQEIAGYVPDADGVEVAETTAPAPWDQAGLTPGNAGTTGGDSPLSPETVPAPEESAAPATDDDIDRPKDRRRGRV